jgi:hypothetical protein
MNIKYSDSYSQKPKNYSRKMFICTCQCPIITFDTNTNKRYNIIIDNVMVKYEIEFNTKSNYIPVKYNKYSYTNYQNFGKFKQVIEIPSVFYKLNDDDYVIKVSRFERDGVMVPFISEIEILNIKNYEIIKNQLDRKKKLNKIINL